MRFIFIIIMALFSNCMAWSDASKNDSGSENAMENITEEHMKALEKFGFGSTIFKQIVVMKTESDRIRSELQALNKDEKNKTQKRAKLIEKEIDDYNAFSIGLRDFLNTLALRLAVNKPFDKNEHDIFSKEMANKWLTLQSNFVSLLDALKELVDQEKKDAKQYLFEEIENIKKVAKEAIDTGIDELSKIMASHIDLLQSYFTERKTPAHQQDLIHFLLDQQPTPIGLPDMQKIHPENEKNEESHDHSHEKDSSKNEKNSSKDEKKEDSRDPDRSGH